jgi:hypothetical protein
MGRNARNRERSGSVAAHQRVAEQRRNASELAPGRWPELRIIRKVDTRGVGGAELRGQWNDFINDLSDRNYGKGNGVALGSSALTLVSAQEMGRMLEKKYPKAYEDRQRTSRLHRRFGEEYNQHIRQDGRDRIDAQYDKLNAAQARTMEADFDDEDEIMITPVAPNSESLLWGAGRFFVDALRPYGKDVFGVDLSSNDLLHEEWSETVNYLSKDGLDTNLMNRHPETGQLYHAPHLRIFETLEHINSVALTYSEDVPFAIDLAAPKARDFK